MKAYIIVYSQTKFMVDGIVKQFAPGRSLAWDQAETVAPSGAEVDLLPGIYGILSDRDISTSMIQAASTAAATNYDVVLLTDKDIWPDPKATAWSRTATAFPTVSAVEVQTFLGGKGV